MMRLIETGLMAGSPAAAGRLDLTTIDAEP
jgi:hypothetical protein